MNNSSPVNKLIAGLKSMLRWGTGGCGGGGTLDDYSQGRSEAEARMRKELRRLLKEYSSHQDQVKFSGHVPCKKCGEVHWMHGPCENAAAKYKSNT